MYLETHNLYLRYRNWASECGYRPVAENKFNTAIMRVYPNAVFDRKRIGVHRPSVVYGIDWFTDHPESTMAAAPIAPPVRFEQRGALHEWESQPDLGF